MRLDALEIHYRALAEKAARPSVTWAGTWESAHSYEPGELVSKSGLWLCLKRTDAMPGTAPDDWRLILHRAKNA